MTRSARFSPLPFLSVYGFFGRARRILLPLSSVNEYRRADREADHPRQYISSRVLDYQRRLRRRRDRDTFRPRPAQSPKRQRRDITRCQCAYANRKRQAFQSFPFLFLPAVSQRDAPHHFRSPVVACHCPCHRLVRIVHRHCFCLLPLLPLRKSHIN